MSRAATLGLACGVLAFATRMAAAESAPSPAVTFAKDVAPIVQKNCQVCHRAGEAAPMSFLSFKEVRPWAKAIREMVVARQMPPWHADPRYGEFANDRRLSDSDVSTVAAWVDGGAREGNPGDLRPNPEFPEGWTIGKPDVVLSMTEDFAVPTIGVVPYKYFVVPTNFKEDRYVQLAEVRQGNRSLVHHVIVDVREPVDGRVPPAGELRPEAGGEAAAQGGRRARDGRLVGWAPGEAPLMLRPGQAKLIKAGSVLVFQVHYTPNGETAKDRTSIGLIFAKGPVDKRVITAAAIGRKLEIPPGDPNYEARSSFTFEENSHIENLHPHMHMRGKDFEVRLVYPDGASKVLLSVPRFDFNWQLTYFFKEPVAAPKGSRMECVAHYDNSAKNKYNPDPTQLVRWGDQTWEEMMVGWFDYTLDDQHLDIRPKTASN